MGELVCVRWYIVLAGWVCKGAGVFGLFSARCVCVYGLMRGCGWVCEWVLACAHVSVRVWRLDVWVCVKGNLTSGLRV